MHLGHLKREPAPVPGLTDPVWPNRPCWTWRLTNGALFLINVTLTHENVLGKPVLLNGHAQVCRGARSSMGLMGSWSEPHNTHGTDADVTVQGSVSAPTECTRQYPHPQCNKDHGVAVPRGKGHMQK